MKKLTMSLMVLAALFLLPSGAEAQIQDCDIQCQPSTPCSVQCCPNPGVPVTTCGEWGRCAGGGVLIRSQEVDMASTDGILAELGVGFTEWLIQPISSSPTEAVKLEARVETPTPAVE